jgi:hypothetical protein
MSRKTERGEGDPFRTGKEVRGPKSCTTAQKLWYSLYVQYSLYDTESPAHPEKKILGREKDL